MKNVANVQLVMEDKSFTSDEGNVIDYIEYSIVFNGEKFVISPRKSDKPLLRYFREKLKEN